MRAKFVRLVLIALISPSLHAADGASLAHLRMGPAGFVAQSPEEVSSVAAIQGAGPESSAPTERGSKLGYEAWARAVFTPAELADPECSAPEAVNGDDGLTNLMRYALGFDLRSDGAVVRSETTQLDEHWFFTYRRPGDIADVDYRVEVSIDLVNWSNAGVTQEPILADDEAATWQAHYHASPGETVWLRLVVTLR